MARHNLLGKEGEEAVAAYLQEEGYTILHRNWRLGHLEVDIVASDGQEVVFVEVKTRSNTLFARPEEAVNPHKIKNLTKAAHAYIQRYCVEAPIRFDIITAIYNESHFEIEHFKNAFYPPWSGS